MWESDDFHADSSGTVFRDVLMLALIGGGALRSACFGPSGATILTGSEDGTARLWDAASGEEMSSLAGHASGIVCARFSSDGRRVITASSDNTARIWPVDLLAAAKRHRPRRFTPGEMAQYEILPPADLEAYRDAWNPRIPRDLTSSREVVRGRPGVVLEASPFEHLDPSVTHEESRWQISYSRPETGRGVRTRAGTSGFSPRRETHFRR